MPQMVFLIKTKERKDEPKFRKNYLSSVIRNEISFSYFDPLGVFLIFMKGKLVND